MDTSKEYIKMCDCEIQDGWEPLIGDFSYLSELNDVSINCGYNREVSCGETWLPRQDQLQAMSGYTWVEFDTLCLATAGRYGISAILTSLETKEQAGIIVVMLEKYGKVWNGEDWRV